MSPDGPRTFNTFRPTSIPINYAELPPLPTIKDQELLKQSLSHQSYFIHGDHPDVDPGDALAHEKACWKALEYRGDTVLSYYLCEVMRRTWPGATASAMNVSLSLMGSTFLR